MKWIRVIGVVYCLSLMTIGLAIGWIVYPVWYGFLVASEMFEMFINEGDFAKKRDAMRNAMKSDKTLH